MIDEVNDRENHGYLEFKPRFLDEQYKSGSVPHRFRYDGLGARHPLDGYFDFSGARARQKLIRDQFGNQKKKQQELQKAAAFLDIGLRKQLAQDEFGYNDDYPNVRSLLFDSR